jgi:hypothetical protein
METQQALKQLEGQLSISSDHVRALSGRLEELLFRAQAIATALKNNVKSSDSMFTYDLQLFRRDVRAFNNEVGGMAGVLSSVERAAQADESLLMRAHSVMRLCDRLHKALAALSDQCLLVNQHIRSAEHKVEAWYLSQEIEALVQSTQGLPSLANKIVLALSSMEGAPAPKAVDPSPAPPAPPAPKPADPLPATPAAPAAQKPRAAVPMRPAGQLKPNIPPSGPGQKS